VSGDVFDCGGGGFGVGHHVGVGAEDRVECGGRCAGEEGLTGLFRRDLLEAQRPADRGADGVHLVDLGEGLRAGEDVLRPGMPVLGQHADADGGDVALRKNVHSRPVRRIRCSDLACDSRIVWASSCGGSSGVPLADR
jgi:hypothetical protein